jgi:limonene-1,2-epoxide hydrolase
MSAPPAAAPQNDRERAVLAFLDALHAPGTPDLDGAASALFAPAATYQALVPTTAVLRGRQAIVDELSRQFTHYSDCDCEVLAIASNDRFVFTERRDHVSMIEQGKRIFSSVAAVFELDDAGRVVSWREYWDTGDIARQLGLTPEQMSALQPTATDAGPGASAS